MTIQMKLLMLEDTRTTHDKRIMGVPSEPSLVRRPIDKREWTARDIIHRRTAPFEALPHIVNSRMAE